MRTRGKKRACRGGTSLIEVVVGILVFAVMVLGSTYYRYLTVLDIEKSRHELTAADLAVTLLETWQGGGGAVTFSPATAFSGHLNIAASAEADAGPAGYTLLGTFDVTVANQTYHSALYWKDVVSDLRELGTAVSWPVGYGAQKQTYQLTTYVRR